MSLSLAYQTLWLPGVLRPTSKFSGGLRDWLGEDRWSPEGQLTARKASLIVHESSALVDSYVNDFVGLSTAAFESASSMSSRPEAPNGCAWQIISYYYAAYFAANALMRLSGAACTNLDFSSCCSINEHFELYNTAPLVKKFSPGVFYLDYSADTQRLVLSSLDAKGGVHIQFWCGFLKFLDGVKSAIRLAPLTAVDLRIARKELEDLRSVLTFGGKQQGAWLSDVRNAVNYRFEHGVWFPYAGAGVTSEALRALLSQRVSGRAGVVPAATSFEDCGRLVSVTGYLLHWLRTALVTIEDKAQLTKRQNIRQGPIAFARIL